MRMRKKEKRREGYLEKGFGVLLVRGHLEVLVRLLQVLSNPETLRVAHAKVELCVAISVLRRFGKPFDRFGQILLDTSALKVGHSQLELQAPAQQVSTGHRDSRCAELEPAREQSIVRSPTPARASLA